MENNSSKIKVKIVFSPSGRQAKIDEGSNLLDVARKLGVDIDSVCGGRAMCGRCQVEVSVGNFPKHGINSKENSLSKPTLSEINYSKKRNLSPLRRLSCQCKVKNDVVIDVPATSQVHNQLIRKNIENRDIELIPPTKLCYIEVREPDMHDPSGDLTRVKEALISQWEYRIKGKIECDLHVLQILQETLRTGDWKITVALRSGKQIIAVWPGLKEQILGAAIDIGSTSVSVILCNLNDGQILSSRGIMNPQIRFGEDLMSRVSYGYLNKDGSTEMSNCIRDAIQTLIEEILNSNSMELENLLELVFVGNPVMHHLLLGIDPIQLGGAPFALATEGSLDIFASEIDLKFNKGTRAYILPCVAGHVGADAAAAVLAESPYNRKNINLIIDVGTNAEIILGNSDFLLAASSPTGPAFEGAQIISGQRATPGAIERVRINPETYEAIYTVVGSNVWSNEESFTNAIKKTGVTGICGSGIIEALGEMFLAGILKSDGTINGDLGKKSNRILEDGRTYKFLICENVIIHQTDIRAIQLAKAALHAGFKLLMSKAGISKVDRVVLAGAFGSHIDPKYAMILGMVPDCKIVNVIAGGNSAGAGARMTLLNTNFRKEIEEVVKYIKKVETAIEPNFQEYFIDAMAFPHRTDKYENLKTQVDFSKIVLSDNLEKKKARSRRSLKRK